MIDIGLQNTRTHRLRRTTGWRGRRWSSLLKDADEKSREEIVEERAAVEGVKKKKKGQVRGQKKDAEIASGSRTD